MPTVKDTFDQMPSRFSSRPGRGGRTRPSSTTSPATAAGRGTPSSRTARVAVSTGPAARPILTLPGRRQDWIDMSTGKQNPQMLFMSGK